MVQFHSILSGPINFFEVSQVLFFWLLHIKLLETVAPNDSVGWGRAVFTCFVCLYLHGTPTLLPLKVV